MDPLLILAALSEAIRLTSVISAQLAQGEITPEEALLQWREVTNRWSNAAFAWHNTEIPDG